ncbi:hypothetical protein [Chryseobacterium sp. RLHN22]|uniref:hypothetical protein n=1 Tax=Chryseobacterium sp. RLHN22 TaxID=3437885 RepID=UPI003D9B0E4A
MNSLYDYINCFDRKIIDNTISINNGEFIVKIIYDKKIINDILPLESTIKSISIKKFKDDCKRLVDELYSFLNVYYLKTNKIPSYCLNQDSSDHNRLFFEINLSIQEELNLNEFIFILSNYKSKEIKQELNFFIIQGFQAIESNKISIVQSNTKTRRLGYLKLIIELFETSNYFPVTYLGKRIETESALYNDALREYGNRMGDDKGLIKKTDTGSSAKPYIELLEELNLLTQINNSFILTKQSKIYFHLNKFLKQKNDIVDSNLFQTNLLDKLFFLRQILVSDPLYIWAILDIVFIAQQPIGTMSIKKLFVDYIKNELDLNQQYSSNNSTKRKIMDLRTRISSWKKPLTYLEHIVEPRINWLVDLGILELKTESKEKQYYFSKSGLNLNNILSEIYEKNLNKQLILQSVINNRYFYIFNYIFNLNKNSSDLDDHKIDSYLLEAFQIFKTDAPNRVAASQAIDYVCFKSFFEDNIIIEFEDIKKYLQKPNNRFSMDWFKTENDGALYLKK